ncbi:glycosyltransferase, partial [bacterium]|nr:glycosyltransferase [bacterium]
IPPLGSEKDLQKSLNSLFPFEQSIQVITADSVSPEFKFSYHTILPAAQTENLTALLNAALPVVQGEFVVVLNPGIAVMDSFIDTIIKRGEAIAKVDYFYGDYYQIDESGEPILVASNPCPDDITEREDWGPLEFYRTEALKRIGGCDPTIRFRPEYYLRLKLTLDRPGMQISTPFCTNPYQSPETMPEAAALFFPGRGKLGGFSYLFMDPAEEQEIEEIFYGALQDRGAFLEQASGKVFVEPARTSPRVSVVIPVHNRANFIPLAVQSVQRGKFQDFEIVIIDNASTDDTFTVAQELAGKDKRVRVIHLETNIIARALNTGVKAARGEYICQLDSDDEYTDDTLASMVQSLDENLDWGLAISYYELMDESGKTLDDFGIIKHLEYNRNNILRVDGAGAVRCWRKAAIDEFGGFNEPDFGHYGEDYDLVLRVGERYEVGRVHEVLYRYRRHGGNSDVLRPHEMKIKNKTLARQRALERRRKLNAARES